MKTKVRLTLYFVLLLIAICTMVLIFNNQKRGNIDRHRDYQEIIDSGTLNVVTDYNSFGYFVSGDTIDGFQYEMIKQLEKDWAIDVNIALENSLDDNLIGLEQGIYDIVARNIPVNSHLLERFNFTQVIVRNKQVLVQRKPEYNDSVPLIRQHLDLSKKTITVPEGSPTILRLHNLSNEIGDTIFVEEHDLYEEEQLVMMVASGDIDYTVCNKIVAKKLAAEFPEIDIDTDISFTQLESWAVRKGSPMLLDSINNWLSSLQKSEEFKRILKEFE